MSREKEIIEASINYTMKNRPNVLSGDRFFEEMKIFNRNKHFEKGAKWADEHPKEGLVSIEQVAKWLDSNFPSIDGVGSWYKEGFINRFKKAMKE